MFVGPYEHHSNELPWRESIADVVVIGEDADGHIDLADLERRAGPVRRAAAAHRQLLGRLQRDRDPLRHQRHRRAAARARRTVILGLRRRRALRADPDGPHPRPGAGDYKDAIFLSPHKFVGGPQTPGVLVVRRELVRNTVPTVPGGGTVAFVDPVGHRYLDDPVAREEGGTPAIVESIRAGLVFGLKQAVGTDLIAAREERLWRQALAPLGAPTRAIEILGSHQSAPALDRLLPDPPRAGCTCTTTSSSRCSTTCSASRPAAAARARARTGTGCSASTPPRSHAFARGDRPRLRGHQARLDPGQLQLLHLRRHRATTSSTRSTWSPRTGYRLLPDYRFDPGTGLWRHRAGPAEPPLRLADVRFGGSGLVYPRHRERVGEEALAAQLAAARELLTGRPDGIEGGPTGLPAQFEGLRWFHLPPSCLAG